MIRILAENDDLHILHGSQFKSLEYLRSGREYHLPLSFLLVELTGEGREIGLFKLFRQRLFPTFLYLDVHIPKDSKLIEYLSDHVIDCLDIMERQSLNIDRLDVLDIFAVILGNDNLMDPGALGSQYLFFYSANRKHPAP